MTNPAPSSPPPAPSFAELVAQTLLGLDYGEARIGVAFKPAGQDWALPRGTIHVDGDEAGAIDELHEALAETGARGVVVGLPLDADPAQAREVRRFCRKARAGLTGVRWYFMDELLTSLAAEALVREAGPLARQRGGADDVAAQLILDGFLQRARNQSRSAG